VVDDQPITVVSAMVRQSSIAFGARAGVIHSLTTSGSDEATEIPIDERFFNGGATTVRSFGERELGPHENHGHPSAENFLRCFNVEYNISDYGECRCVFTDAGNLLPTFRGPLGEATCAMRWWSVCVTKAAGRPDSPSDYVVNPDPHEFDDFGRVHFSFGSPFATMTRQSCRRYPCCPLINTGFSRVYWLQTLLEPLQQF
jgi:hypothetical protein